VEFNFITSNPGAVKASHELGAFFHFSIFPSSLLFLSPPRCPKKKKEKSSRAVPNYGRWFPQMM
jgi:hypothetical protein